MGRKQSVVRLDDGEPAHLRPLVGHGCAAARMLTQARILLQADAGEAGPGWTDAASAGALDVHRATGACVRQQDATAGLAAALTPTTPHREYRRTLDGTQEAHLVALVARACRAPPEGRRR